MLGWPVGELAPGDMCIEFDDDRRKKGIDDGVSFLDVVRLADGLKGVCSSGAGPRVLALDPVSDRLGASRSGLLLFPERREATRIGELEADGTGSNEADDEDGSKVRFPFSVGDQTSVEDLGDGLAIEFFRGRMWNPLRE